MNSYSTGDYVRAGATTDDYDVGRIVEIMLDGRLYVAWTSGAETCELAEDLRPSCRADYRSLLEASKYGE